MIIVSACLGGIKCRYNGKRIFNEKVIQLISQAKAIPVCPEQLGGLSTPRVSSEIQNSRVITQNGKDVTKEFVTGAKEAFRLCLMIKCTKAILKSKSPSCGYGQIYDGNFSKTLISGNGIFAQMLDENGIKIYTEEHL